MEGSEIFRRSVPAIALMGTVGLLRAAKNAYDPARLAEAEAALFQTVKTTLTHRYVQAGRHQLHTVIAGSGPPLVVLHGHGGGVGVWIDEIDALAAHYRLYLVDWLGWGRSDRPAYTGSGAERSRDWWVESLEDWRRAMGLEDFYLLGHSLGGWLAAEYTMRYPARVRHLLLENPAGLAARVVPIKGLFYLVSPQRVVQAIGPLGLRLVEYGVGEQLETSRAATALLDYYYQLSIAPLSGQIAFEQILSPWEWHLPLVPRAHLIQRPTTIIWGLNDDLFRVRDAHKFDARLPDSRLFLCPNAFHSPHNEQPDLFNEVVIGTLGHQSDDLARAS